MRMGDLTEIMLTHTFKERGIVNWEVVSLYAEKFDVKPFRMHFFYIYIRNYNTMHVLMHILPLYALYK